jgi:hypothetical protein
VQAGKACDKDLGRFQRPIRLLRKIEGDDHAVFRQPTQGALLSFLKPNRSVRPPACMSRPRQAGGLPRDDGYSLYYA